MSLIVVMGVSGSGKTTVGTDLAAKLGVPFADADDFHSPANVAKMSAGIPLTDEDRLPWLRTIRDWLAGHRETGAVVTCSALKRAYRELLGPGLFFVHLDGDLAVVRERMTHRNHFMPAALLDSQAATLEPLQAGEPGIRLDLALPVHRLVEQALAAIGPG
ncbi:gluconokinase [Pseudonocardiaceae bacterium YIM PH 21723]|nr:gluconokinase [Pseudonocardiaceae bacterium YIM PH 21723]